MTTTPQGGPAPLLVRARTWLAANTWTPSWQPTPLRRPIIAYLLATVAVVLAAGLTFLLEHSLARYSFHGMIAFLALLGISMTWGPGPAALGALLNAIILNFVVVSPQLAAPPARLPAIASHLLAALLTLCLGAAVVVLAGLSESRRRQLVEVHAARERVLARAEAALRRLEAVQAVMDTALAHLPAQDLLRQLLARVATALGADNAALLLVTEDGRSLVVYLAHGVVEDQEGAVIVPIGQGIAGRIAASGQPLIVDDVSSADISNVRLLAAVRSLAGVPVMAQDRLVGVLHADSTSARRFTAEDLEVLRLVAERIGLVVENGRLYAEAQQHSADLATERDRLRRILHVLPEAVIIFDADARVGAQNPAAITLFGAHIAGEQRRDLEIAVRQPDGTPLSGEQLPSTRALKAGETSRGVRLIARDATGDDVPLLISCAPLRDPDGAITGAVEVAQDISALVELERQRERMLSLVTHDLRNPLTTIVGTSQLLQQHVARVDEPARDRFTHGLRSIERAAGRMTAHIGDLLDHARALAGRPLELALEDTDIVGLLRGVLEEQQHATERHRLELRCADERIVAMVDRSRLERAVTNLVGNAVKYSPQGGPVVVSAARAVGSGGAWLSIEVIDHGIGIPSAELPRIFEQYYRASNVAATVPGNGIGLAGARRVIQQHGGTLTLASIEGEGTTVMMRLPLWHEGEHIDQTS